MTHRHDVMHTLRRLEERLNTPRQRTVENPAIDAENRIRRVRAFILWAKGPGQREIKPFRLAVLENTLQAAYALVDVITLAAFAPHVETRDIKTIAFLVDGIQALKACITSLESDAVSVSAEHAQWARGVVACWKTAGRLERV